MWSLIPPAIMQAEKNECGLACMAMILNYYGYKTDILSLRKLSSVSQYGGSFESLVQIACDHKLSAAALRLELNELPKLNLPAILHWDMNHFVVLCRVSSNSCLINDPAVGAIRLTREEVGNHFTGAALELQPEESFQKADVRKRLTIRDIWRSSEGMAGVFRGLLLSFVLSLLLLIFSLILPFYSQIVIDEVIASGDEQLLFTLAIGFLFITTTRVFTELIRSFLLLQVGSRLSFNFASGIYQRLLRIKADYFLRRHVGDITSRFRSINNVRDFISSGAVGIIVDGLLVSVTLTLMFFYSVNLTLIALIAVCIYALIKIFTFGKVAQLNTRLLEETGKENTVFIENIRAVQGIKLFGREKERNLVWQHEYSGVINAGIRLQQSLIYIQSANSFLLGGGNVLLIFLGTLAVLDQSLTIGMFIAYLQFKDQFYSRVFTFLDKVFEFKLLNIHLIRLSDIFFAENEARSGLQVKESSPLQIVGEKNTKTVLSVDNLSFRYPPGQKHLFENVSFSLEESEAIAIIGPTGCGKSTLLKVILSLLSPETGCICFRGIDINVLGVDLYRSQLAAILQDDSLISGTILENISFFDENIDMGKVEEAAHLAGIHEEIRAMPMQYNTFVGNMGADLSGGQVQRIMLARAFYKGTKLLITDEATSDLDLEKEEEVMQAFSKLKVARIIVAHRPNTIMKADRVLQLTPHGLIPVDKRKFADSLK